MPILALFIVQWTSFRFKIKKKKEKKDPHFLKTLHTLFLPSGTSQVCFIARVTYCFLSQMPGHSASSNRLPGGRSFINNSNKDTYLYLISKNSGSEHFKVDTMSSEDQGHHLFCSTLLCLSLFNLGSSPPGYKVAVRALHHGLTQHCFCLHGRKGKEGSALAYTNSLRNQNICFTFSLIISVS